jgi:hypothetical protein
MFAPGDTTTRYE